MRDLFGNEAVKGFCRCNSFKYRFRAGNKPSNDAEKDLKKLNGMKTIYKR